MRIAVAVTPGLVVPVVFVRRGDAIEGSAQILQGARLVLDGGDGACGGRGENGQQSVALPRGLQQALEFGRQVVDIGVAARLQPDVVRADLEGLPR